ncbi:MAG TPA: thermonuclease family protein, partial [Saprospiraceae bacterium]|nr:thermonuclease family protein [Saprospiraceae bacterium]
ATSLLGFVLPLQSFAATYQVTQVLSGDTLRVEDQRGNFMVRLIGIDAPKGPPDDQPFSERAKTHLASMVQNQMVEIYSYGFDDDGRMLGLVFANDRNINLEMVKAGFAEVDRGELTSSFDLGPYRDEEREAKAAKRGMWVLGNKYVSPRNWVETGDHSSGRNKIFDAEKR